MVPAAPAQAPLTPEALPRAAVVPSRTPRLVLIGNATPRCRCYPRYPIKLAEPSSLVCEPEGVTQPAQERECHCVLHEPPPSTADWTAGDRKLVADVQDHGWHVVKVVDPDADSPWWAFTVGLWHSYGVPELTMAGLLPGDMHTWLNVLGKRARDGKGVVDEGSLVEGVLEGYALRARRVATPWYRPLFGAALWFAQKPPLPMAQLVWPDRTGRYPEDPGCGERCSTDQPRLWLQPEEHPPGLWRSWGLEG